MTRARLRAILALLRWSQRDLAHHARVDERTARRWAAGAYPVPARLSDWLEAAAAWLAANPAP